MQNSIHYAPASKTISQQWPFFFFSIMGLKGLLGVTTLRYRYPHCSRNGSGEEVVQNCTQDAGSWERHPLS